MNAGISILGATFLLLTMETALAQNNAPGGFNQGANSSGTIINNYGGQKPPDLGNICYTQLGGYTNPAYLRINAPCSVNINGRVYPGYIGVAGQHPNIVPAQ
jgi:hypothetical protein